MRLEEVMSEYKKLVPDAETKGEGNFVRGLEGTTGTGFAGGHHVHGDWLQGTTGYGPAKERAQLAFERRRDLLVPMKNIVATWDWADDEHPQFGIEANDEFFTLTGHALEQFSKAIGIPSTVILSRMGKQVGFDQDDAKTMSELANNAIRRVDRNKQFRIRSYDDENLVRAFVTDKYTCIDNRWFLDQLEEALPQARLSHWKNSDEDTLYGNLLLPDQILDRSVCPDDSDYGGMVSVSNCEIGKRALGVMPSLFRAICKNGCIWGQTEGIKLRQLHRGNFSLEDLRDKIHRNIHDQLAILPMAMREFFATRERKLNDLAPRTLIAAVARQSFGSFNFQFTKSEATKVFEQYETHESGERTLFGIVNAITRAGQELSADRWNHFDRAGGHLVTMSDRQWNALWGQANTLTGPEVGRRYSTSLASVN